jgi:Fic family protein
MFAYAPVESIIKSRQLAYYQALAESDKAGESTTFIEFCLLTIRDSLVDLESQIKGSPISFEDRLHIAQRNFEFRTFARKDYMILFKTISTATASRDLLNGVQSGLLRKTGEKALTRYVFSKGSSSG